MIGVYKITNKVTNQCYIGQSVNIERRFTEHKTPKAWGNDSLHNDIKKYGVQNFDFEILEICKPSELLEKELYFIKKLKPHYNYVGKPIPEKTRKKISKGVKIWWDALDEEMQQKIIKNNLKGPRKGHEVLKSTREKISRKISEIQKQKVKCVETGEIFQSIGDFEKSVGAYSGACAFYWRGKIKTVKGYHVEKV